MPERTSAQRDAGESGSRGHAVRNGTTALVLLALGAFGAIRLLPEAEEPPHCSVAGRDGAEAFTLEPGQAASAATIEAVASSRGLSERAVTIAIATAMQESGLRNIDYGDRDSLGLFQQRPSMGWGTEQQVMDPVYAAGAFYDHLVEVPEYEALPLTEAAQAVQRSAFPDAYAKHEERAALLAAALTGRAPAALSCGWDTERAAGDPAEVHERMVREFGDGVRPVGEGDGLTVPVVAGEETRRGWELAHWAVAHSADLGIERIAYGNHLWEARQANDGWRDVSGESTDGENADRQNGAGSAEEVQLSVFAGE